MPPTLVRSKLSLHYRGAADLGKLKVARVATVPGIHLQYHMTIIMQHTTIQEAVFDSLCIILISRPAYLTLQQIDRCLDNN